MKNKYLDLIQQTFDFPVEEFKVDDEGQLSFHDIPLMELIKQAIMELIKQLIK